MFCTTPLSDAILAGEAASGLSSASVVGLTLLDADSAAAAEVPAMAAAAISTAPAAGRPPAGRVRLALWLRCVVILRSIDLGFVAAGRAPLFTEGMRRRFDS